MLQVLCVDLEAEFRDSTMDSEKTLAWGLRQRFG